MSEFKYITTAPGLTIKLAGKRYTAVGGVLDIPPEAARELDGLLALKDRGDIRAVIRKVDMEVAAARAKEHLANMPKAAVRGVVTSGTSAQQQLRDAAHANKPERATGILNPINTSTKPDQTKPVDVQVFDTAQPPKGLASKLGSGK